MPWCHLDRIPHLAHLFGTGAKPYLSTVAHGAGTAVGVYICRSRHLPALAWALLKKEIMSNLHAEVLERWLELLDGDASTLIRVKLVKGRREGQHALEHVVGARDDGQPQVAEGDAPLLLHLLLGQPL